MSDLKWHGTITLRRDEIPLLTEWKIKIEKLALDIENSGVDEVSEVTVTVNEEQLDLISQYWGQWIWTLEPVNDTVRVFRLIEYVGPREQVEDQINNSLHGEKQFGQITIKAATIGIYPECMTKY
jgi:hypothetical protein